MKIKPTNTFKRTSVLKTIQITPPIIFCIHTFYFVAIAHFFFSLSLFWNSKLWFEIASLTIIELQFCSSIIRSRNGYIGSFAIFFHLSREIQMQEKQNKKITNFKDTQEKWNNRKYKRDSTQSTTVRKIYVII